MPSPRKPNLLGWFFAIAAVSTVTLFLLPLTSLAFAGPAANPVDIDWGSLGTSVAVAVTASCIATIIGSALAALLFMTDLPKPRVWAALLVLPFACSPTVWAMAQMACYGDGGLIERALGTPWRSAVDIVNRGNYLATALVLAQLHIPIAILIVDRGWSRLHLTGIDAARVSLSRGRFFAWLVGAVRGECLASALLCFVLCLGNFGIPQVLQCRLYTIDVYMRMNNYMDPAGAVRAALPLLAIVIVVTIVLVWLRPFKAKPLAHAAPRTKTRLRNWRWPATGMLAIYVLLTTLLPIGSLAANCRSASDFGATLRDALPELGNTLTIAAGASFLATLAAIIVSGWAVKYAWRLLDGLAIATLALPSLVVGLAVSQFFNRTEPLDLTWLGDTHLLILFGLALRCWPFGLVLAAIGYRSLSQQWIETAQLSQVPAPIRWWRITFPITAEHLAASGLIAFLLAGGDVEISQMLCAPGGGTLSLRLFTFLHFGPSHTAAGLAMIQLIIATLPVGIFFVVFRSARSDR